MADPKYVSRRGRPACQRWPVFLQYLFGGEATDHIIHNVDVAVWPVVRPEPRSLTACAGRPAREKIESRYDP